MLDWHYRYLANRRISLDLNDIAWYNIINAIIDALYYVTIMVSNCLGFLTLTVNVLKVDYTVHGDGIKVKHLQAKGG